jgi:hypothetical protein
MWSRNMDLDYERCNTRYGKVVRFEVFMAVTMKNAVFRDVATCRSYVSCQLQGKPPAVDLITSLATMEQRKISCLCWELNLGHLALSLSLYQLSYSGFCTMKGVSR